jgi:hypothetical protein
VTFNEDQSRLRVGHSAKNMAVVRHFALNLVRQVVDKRSIKRRRGAPLGILHTCWKYWARCDVNLDSLPWVEGHHLRRVHTADRTAGPPVPAAPSPTSRF